MKLLNRLKIFFRSIYSSKLDIKKEIVLREMECEEHDSSRRSWVLNEYMHLCPGDLEELKHNYHFKHDGLEYLTASSIAPTKFTVQIPLPSDEEKLNEEGSENSPKKPIEKSLEEKLKYGLYIRGYNAGIFYKTYEEKGNLYAEAVPANISSE